MVSISILLYGQLLQVIGYIETRTDIKYDEKEDVVNMCKAQDDHKKLGIQEGIQQGRCLEIYSLVQDGILEPEDKLAISCISIILHIGKMSMTLC